MKLSEDDTEDDWGCGAPWTYSAIPIPRAASEAPSMPPFWTALWIQLSDSIGAQEPRQCRDRKQACSPFVSEVIYEEPIQLWRVKCQATSNHPTLEKDRKGMPTYLPTLLKE